MARVHKLIGWPLLAAWGYGALYYAANRSVYQPMKYPRGIWEAQLQLDAQDVWLQAGDGTRLHAWRIQRPDARLVTLFLHGNAGNITHRFAHAREITAAGSSLLLLDYRGYGKSQGSPSEKGVYADAEAAYQSLLDSGYSAGQVVLHGESLGTAVAVELATRLPCAGLVLEAPFTSARDVAASALPVLGPMVIWGFNSKRKISEVNAPLLIVHGDRDEIIPLDHGHELFRTAHEPKSFWTVEGAGHDDIVPTAGIRYRERLSAFYESLQ